MNNDTGTITNIKSQEKESPHTYMFLIRNGLETPLEECPLIKVGDIIRSGDTKYLISKGGVWRKIRE